jgi:hypothetical protein
MNYVIFIFVFLIAGYGAYRQGYRDGHKDGKNGHPFN